MFQFEPGLAVWTLVSFAIVLFVIQRYVYPPVKKILQTRRETIDRDIEAAEKSRAEAASLREDLEKRMHSVRIEEQRILVEAREKAREMYAEYERKALDEIRVLRKTREEDLQRIEEGFYQRTRKEFSQLVMHTCERVLRTELPEEVHRKIIQERIQELDGVEQL